MVESEYWSQVASGYTPQTPGDPLAYSKFIAYLQVAGINTATCETSHLKRKNSNV